MDSPKERLYPLVTISIVLYVCTFISSDNCNKNITRPVLAGFRCVTDDDDTNITGIQGRMCANMCITRKDCSIVKYNIQQKGCHLRNGLSIMLEVDNAFQVNNLGLIHRSENFHWLPSSAIDNI